MDESRKVRERDDLKAVILLLARKGYVLKSELKALFRGCRYNAFVLADLEQILFESAEESVQYIDDGDGDPDGSCRTELQDETEKPREEQKQARKAELQVLLAEGIFAELQRRAQFAFLELKQSEYELYLRDMMLLHLLDEASARKELDGYLESLQFTVEPDPPFESERKARSESFLIQPEKNAVKEEKDTSRSIGQFRSLPKG